VGRAVGELAEADRTVAAHQRCVGGLLALLEPVGVKRRLVHDRPNVSQAWW
jgi:hypothetical protein